MTFDHFINADGDLGLAARHWQALRGASPKIPARADLSLAAIAPALTRLSIYELTADKRIRLRITGEELQALWERPISGLYIDELYAEEALGDAMGYFLGMYEQPCGGHTSEILTTVRGARVEVETLWLPMSDANGEVRFLVTVSAMNRVGHEVEEPVNVMTVDHKALQYARYVDVGFGLSAHPQLNPLLP